MIAVKKQKNLQMLLLFLFWEIVFVFQCVTTQISDPGIIEIDKSGSILHYFPVSFDSHWLLQPSDEGTEYLVGPGTVIFHTSANDSLFITFTEPVVSFENIKEISSLVRCYLGCDVRLEAMAFDERCEISLPPACVRFIPRFRHLDFCLTSGNFVSNPLFLLETIDDALAAGRLNAGQPYNVTFTC